MKRLPPDAKILITRTDRIGDLVVSTPVFHLLRGRFPEAYLAACVFSEHRELIEENIFLNEVIPYEKSGSEKNILGQLAFAKKIRAKKFDCVIHLHATNRMHLMGWLAGIPVRIGYDRRAQWALTQVFKYDKKEGMMHESEYLAALIAEAFPPGPAHLSIPFPSVGITERNKLSAENLLEHTGLGKKLLAVIHPSASDISKIWPAAKFADFLKTWPDASRFEWAAVGGREAAGLTAEIARLSGFAIADLCGKLSLGMLSALFSRTALVISNDSGPAHIAAAAGAPTVSIFGRWQPGLNAERWRPLGRKTAVVVPQVSEIPPQQRRFSYIEDISAEQVIHAVEGVLR